MTKYDWENRLNADDEVFAIPNSRDPRKFPVGIFVGGTFVLDSVRVFEWFQSPHEMLKWMQLAEPLSHRADENIGELRTRIGSAIGALEANGGELTEEILRSAAEPLADLREIQWWGRFSDLLSGNGDFENRVRSEFWELEENETAGSSPVTDKELQAFVEFLETYGI